MQNKIDETLVRYISISHDDPHITSEEKLRFDAAISMRPGMKEQGEVGRQVLKGGRYAIFTHFGPYGGLTDVFNSIFLKWLPASRERYDDTRTVYCEHFFMEFAKTDPAKLVTKLFVPLV